MDMIKKPADRASRCIKIYANQNFQFHFHYRVMSKNILIKTQKLQLCCCPDGLLSSGTTKPCQMHTAN